MLKSAGFAPEIVLAADLPAIDALNRLENIPVEGFFSTPLVKVGVGGKKMAYLNDTNQYAELGTTPNQDNMALFCSTGDLGKIDVLPPCRSSMDAVYAIRLQADGRAVIKTKRVFRGNDYAYWKRKYAEMTEEERDRHFQQLVADLSQSAQPIGKLHTDFSKYPGVVTFTVEAPRFAALENNYLYMKLPQSLGDALGIRSDSRDTPFLIGRAKKSTRTYILTLPEQFAKKVPIAPKTDSWELPCGAGRIAVTNDRDIFGPSPKPVMFIQQEMDVKPAFIPKNEFEMARLLAGKMANRGTRTLLLEKTDDRVASYDEQTIPAGP